MLRYIAPLLCLAACDAATDPNPAADPNDDPVETSEPAVFLQRIHSSLAICGGRSSSDLAFEVVNDGAEPIVLQQIDIDAVVASGHQSFDEGLTVPAGGRLNFTCVGGFGGLAEQASGPSTATLSFTVGGVSATRSDTGDHVNSLLWDFCDTGIPNQGPAGCVVVDPAE